MKRSTKVSVGDVAPIVPMHTTTMPQIDLKCNYTVCTSAKNITLI